MNNLEVSAFAFATPNMGEQNQLLGAFKAISDITGVPDNGENNFLLPPQAEKLSDVKETIAYSKYPSYKEFRKDIYAAIDKYLQKGNTVPGIFLIAYNQAQNKAAGENVDMACRAVKEYYKEHNLGNIITGVLTSRLHKYQYVDLIHVPKHLLTLNARIRLLQNKKLKKKTLITIGTINNFNRRTVKEKNTELLKTLKKYKEDASLLAQIQKLEWFINNSKKIVLCLGGRVDGSEIIFDLNYAKKIFDDAEKLSKSGYGIAIVNGPRTPNDVTDFLYEKSLQPPHIIFQNCKKIAEDDSDRTAQRWRIYSGKNEEAFKNLQKIGNIYPGILGFENTLVMHTIDSYSCCETANAAIPTAISSKGLYIDASLRYDCLNLQKLLCPKYAIDWDDFVKLACHMRVEPKDLNPQILSSPLRVFAETIINRINTLQKK